MERLPEEIILEILRFVRCSADQDTLSSCMLCCRRFYRICLPMLYTDVVLQAGTTWAYLAESEMKRIREKFAHRVTSFSSSGLQQADLITSLTMRTASCNFDWPKWRPWMLLERRKSEREQWLPTLCRVLPQLKALTTFSFKVGDAEQRVFWTPQSRVADILDVLPASVINLEIDSMGADFVTTGPSNTPSHICKSLSRIVPRLRMLRIRLRFLCSSMFDSVAEDNDRHDSVTDTEEVQAGCALEVCSIVLAPRIGTVGSQSTLLESRLCGTFDRPQAGDAFHNLSTVLRDLYTEKKLPNLREGKIVDRSRDEGGSGYEVYDAVTNESESYTFSRAYEQGLLYTADSMAIYNEMPVLAPTRPDGTEDVRLDYLAEGQAAWLDTSWRSRRPQDREEV